MPRTRGLRPRLCLAHFSTNELQNQLSGVLSLLWAGWESNPHEGLTSADFKSAASAIPPPAQLLKLYGGILQQLGQIVKGDQ